MLARMTETDGPGDISYKIPTHADFMIAYSTVPGMIPKWLSIIIMWNRCI